MKKISAIAICLLLLFTLSLNCFAVDNNVEIGNIWGDVNTEAEDTTTIGAIVDTETNASENAENREKSAGVFDLTFFKSVLFEAKNILSSLAEKSFTVYSAIILIISLATCFAGYKIMRFFLSVGGFFVGAFVAGRILSYFGFGGGVVAKIMVIVAALFVGALIASLAYKFTMLGVFLLGSFAAYLIFVELPISSLAAIIIAIICGAVACFFVRVAIILSSSISGGMAAGSALVGFIPAISELPYIHVLLGVILSILGMSAQFSVSYRRRKKKSEN